MRTAASDDISKPLLDGSEGQLADQKQIAGLKAGTEIPARDYLKAMRIRRIIKQEIANMFTDVDLLLGNSRRPATTIARA